MQSNTSLKYLSKAEAKYIKAIYKILETNGTGIATTGEISNSLNIKGGSVTEMLKKLHNKKVLFYGKNKGTQLTTESIEFAKNLIWKHKIWRKFLTEKLFFTERLAKEIANDLEHLQPQNLSERLEEFLNRKEIGSSFVEKENITASVGNIVELSKMKENTEGNVLAYGSVSSDFLDYMLHINLKLGTPIKFIKYIKFADSIEIIIDKSATFHINSKIAEAVIVKV